MMRIKIKRYIVQFDYWVLISILLLLRLPVALGYRQQPVVRMLFLLPLVAVTLKNIVLTLYKAKFHFNKLLLILFSLFALILALAFIRTARSTIFPASTIFGNMFIWMIVAAFGFTLFATAPSVEVKRDYRRGIFFAINLYFIFNAIFHFVGIRSPEILYLSQTKAAMLTSIGINTNRVLFPTAGGLNSFGTTAGLGLVSSLVIITSKNVNRKFDKFLSLFAVLITIAIILLADSRGALAYSILVLFLILFLPKIYYKLLAIIPIVAPLLPVAMITILNLLPSTLISTLSRSGSDLANMSNRLVIWDIILKHLSNFSWVSLIGYGYRGQVVSGVSHLYAYLFTSYTNDEVASAHNFLLQNVLEIGYIGAVIFIILLFVLIRNLSRANQTATNDYTPKAMLFVLIYLILSGITEAVFSPDYQEVFTVFILIWTATGTMEYSRAPDNLAVPEKSIRTGPSMESVSYP